MKVLMISGLFPLPTLPQYAIFIKELADAVGKQGIQLDIAVPLRRSELKQNGLNPDGERRGNVIYFPYFRFPKYYNLAFAGLFLVAALEKQFGNKIQEYDIFHAHGTLPEGTAAVRLAEKYCKKSIIQVHGYDVYFEMSTSNRILKLPNIHVCSKNYSKSDLVIGVSQYVLNRILLRDVKLKSQLVLYNGVNLKNFYPEKNKNKRDLKDRKCRVITVGNLIPVKRICDIVDAVQILNEQDYDVSLVIFGRGPLEEQLIQQVKRYNMGDKVEFKGYQPVEIVSNEIRQADIFVLAGQYEAFGCVYTEAMASGIPIIASNNIGISEIIEDGNNGFLVDAGHPEQIAEKIEELICNRILYGNVVQKGLETVENYTWDKEAEILCGAYRGLLNE